MTANDRQVAGSHYKTGYQHWDLAWNCRMSYFPGQITKYISRYKQKKGMEDLQKALHFIEKYEELLINDDISITFNGLSTTVLVINAEEYLLANPHLGELEKTIIRALTSPHNAHVVGLLKEPASQLILAFKE